MSSFYAFVARTPTRLAVGLVVLFLAIGLAVPLAAQPLHVARIIDGDTFELSDGRKVRLIGIDTPETYVTAKLARDAERTGRDQATIQALGARATEAARRLAADRAVVLDYDPANAATGHRGSYGRTLAYVWVVDASGRRQYMVNERLVAEGYAHAYLKYPFQYAATFRELERQARAAGLGLWGPSGLTAMAYAEREASAHVLQEPGIVYVTDTGRRYHRASCAHLRYSKTAVELGGLPARYTPCRVCHPPERP